MLARIPFTYPVVGIEKGCRKLEHLTCGAWADIEIAEISPGDAPVAMSWNEEMHGGGKRLKEARWDGERLWTELGAGHHTGNAVFAATELGELRDGEVRYVRQRSGACSSLVRTLAASAGDDPYSLSAFVTGSRDVRPLDPAEMREIAWSGYEEAHDRTVAAWQDLAIIDGIIWTAGVEPFYEVHLPGMGWASRADRAAVVTMLPGPPRAAPTLYWTRFRADRLDDAIDCARQASGGREPHLFDPIEVIIPEAVMFDDEAEAILRASREAVREGYAMLMHRGREGLTAWTDLKLLLDAGPADPEALAEALRAIGRSFPPETGPARIAAHASARWDIRPLASSLPSP